MLKKLLIVLSVPLIALSLMAITATARPVPRNHHPRPVRPTRERIDPGEAGSCGISAPG